MKSDDTKSVRSVGRPRDDDLDERIKRSSLRVLAEDGFRNLSVNRICKDAKITRPTFYRRWDSPQAIIAEAFNERFENASLEDSGDVRVDLKTFAIKMRDRYLDPVIGSCLPAISEVSRSHPELIKPLADAQQVRIQINLKTINSAMASQGIHCVLSPSEIYQTLAAAIIRGYNSQLTITDDFIEKLVTTLTRPI